jgi:hypothetical protein
MLYYEIGIHMAMQSAMWQEFVYVLFYMHQHVTSYRARTDVGHSARHTCMYSAIIGHSK